MKQKIKKIFSELLIIMITFSVLPVPSFAEDTTSFDYQLLNNNVYENGYMLLKVESDMHINDYTLKQNLPNGFDLKLAWIESSDTFLDTDRITWVSDDFNGGELESFLLKSTIFSVEEDITNYLSDSFIYNENNISIDRKEVNTEFQDGELVIFYIFGKWKENTVGSHIVKSEITSPSLSNMIDAEFTIEVKPKPTEKIISRVYNTNRFEAVPSNPIEYQIGYRTDDFSIIDIDNFKKTESLSSATAIPLDPTLAIPLNDEYNIFSRIIFKHTLDEGVILKNSVPVSIRIDHSFVPKTLWTHNYNEDTRELEIIYFGPLSPNEQLDIDVNTRTKPNTIPDNDIVNYASVKRQQILIKDEKQFIFETEEQISNNSYIAFSTPTIETRIGDFGDTTGIYEIGDKVPYRIYIDWRNIACPDLDYSYTPTFDEQGFKNPFPDYFHNPYMYNEGLVLSPLVMTDILPNELAIQDLENAKLYLTTSDGTTFPLNKNVFELTLNGQELKLNINLGMFEFLLIRGGLLTLAFVAEVISDYENQVDNSATISYYDYSNSSNSISLFHAPNANVKTELLINNNLTELKVTDNEAVNYNLKVNLAETGDFAPNVLFVPEISQTDPSIYAMYYDMYTEPNASDLNPVYSVTSSVLDDKTFTITNIFDRRLSINNVKAFSDDVDITDSLLIKIEGQKLIVEVPDDVFLEDIKNHNFNIIVNATTSNFTDPIYNTFELTTTNALNVENTVSNEVVLLKKENETLNGTISFYKKDNHGDSIEGAEFALYTKDTDVEVAKEMSNTDGIVSMTDIPYGDYYLQEVSVPDGYILNDTKIDITINSSFCMLDTIINHLNSWNVTFKIVDTDSGLGIPNSIWALISDNNTIIKTSDNDGIVDFAGISEDNYELKEIGVPTGYKSTEFSIDDLLVDEDKNLGEISIQHIETSNDNPITSTTASIKIELTEDTDDLDVAFVQLSNGRIITLNNETDFKGEFDNIDVPANYDVSILPIKGYSFEKIKHSDTVYEFKTTKNAETISIPVKVQFINTLVEDIPNSVNITLGNSTENIIVDNGIFTFTDINPNDNTNPLPEDIDGFEYTVTGDTNLFIITYEYVNGEETSNEFNEEETSSEEEMSSEKESASEEETSSEESETSTSPSIVVDTDNDDEDVVSNRPKPAKRIDNKTDETTENLETEQIEITTKEVQTEITTEEKDDDEIVIEENQTPKSNITVTDIPDDITNAEVENKLPKAGDTDMFTISFLLTLVGVFIVRKKQSIFSK